VVVVMVVFLGLFVLGVWWGWMVLDVVMSYCLVCSLCRGWDFGLWIFVLYCGVFVVFLS
jgi:hypothetical protein